MKIVITGSQSWGDHAQAAEEIVAGFVSKLPRGTIVITLGENDGPGVWAGRYARAYKFHITELAPQQVKGAAHYVKNFSQRDKNAAEQADRVFVFLYSPAEVEAEIADLMTVVRLHHTAYTVYNLSPDEEDDERLKLVNMESVEARELLPGKEKKDGSGRSPAHTRRDRRAGPKRSKEVHTEKRTAKPVRRARAHRSVPKVQRKSRVHARSVATGKDKPRARVPARVSVPKGTGGRDKGDQKVGGKTIVLKRI